jgi:hypothetical protein
MKLVNKIGYITKKIDERDANLTEIRRLAKKIDDHDANFYEMRDAHLDNESYVERIDKCYDEFQKALRGLRTSQAGGRRSRNRRLRKTRRSKK